MPALRIGAALCWVGILLVAQTIEALDNGLGLTPPMGFSTWYDVGCANLTEDYVVSLADRLIKTNMSSLGYRYVNIDDCWQVGRDASGALLADPAGFPHGMKALGQKIHARGLKFGLYTDRGKMTCQKRPGSLSHETLDAITFASWGVDYLKEDSCYAPSIFHKRAFDQYLVMRDALNKTKRRMFFSLCGWNPWYAPKGAQLGNSWRIAPDNLNWNSVYVAAREMERLTAYSGPGGWNDPDFVLGSNPLSKTHLTPRQSRTQFSLWCVMAAPLMLSGPDALIPGTFDFQTFSNSRALAINQDGFGIAGKVVYTTCPRLWLPAWTAPIDAPPRGCTQVWVKGPLKHRKNAIALVFVNWDAHKSIQVTCNAACMRLAGIPPSASIVSIEDVWGTSDDGGGVQQHLNTGLGSAGMWRRSSFKYIPPRSRSSESTEDGLLAPGRIETVLDNDGGSAFLIVEYSDSDPDGNGNDDFSSIVMMPNIDHILPSDDINEVIAVA